MLESPARLVLGLGEVLWDLQPHGKQLGGAPANFAYHVNAQGIAAAPVSAVGEDKLGRELLAELSSRGVDTAFVQTAAGMPTSTVDVELDDGKPTYTIHEGVAWDRINFTEALETAAKSARAVCYGTLAQRGTVSRETITRILRATPDDCLRVFDVNLRQSFWDKAIITNGLTYATVFKLSDEEVDDVASALDLPSDPQRFTEELLVRFENLDLLIITRGGDGSTLRRRSGETSQHGTEKADVVSTVGAGDSFTAGVVAGLLKGQPLGLTHAFASKLAAYVVSRSGAMPTLPDDLRL